MKLDKNLKDKKPTTPEPLTSKDKLAKREEKPIVGITYLDKNKYGLIDLFRVHRSDNSSMRRFVEFLERARRYTTITELKKNHASHIKSKNTDKNSREKMNRIQIKYGIDTSDMFHLHCGIGGTGEFVLHGFFLGNCFEIVWLDAKHEVHS